jgi:hypothetical protein
MKISLKSPTLDLDIDGVKKLDDVLDFVDKFKKLELAAEVQARVELASTDVVAKRSSPPGKKKLTE